MHVKINYVHNNRQNSKKYYYRQQDMNLQDWKSVKVFDLLNNLELFDKTYLVNFNIQKK